MEKQVSFLVILKEGVISVGKWVEIHSAFVTAVATIFIAAFTWALVWATIKLWKVSLRQSNDMETSLKIARDTADAARKSAKVAEHAMIHSQRAYVFIKEFFRDMKLIPNVAKFGIVLENTGETPVKNMICNFEYCTFIGEIPKDFEYPDTGVGRQYGIIGRKTTLDIQILMPLKVFEDAFNKKIRLFVYGWIDYNDVFPNTPRHRTESCYEIEVNNDRSFTYKIYGKYNGSDDECYRKPSPYTLPT